MKLVVALLAVVACNAPSPGSPEVIPDAGQDAAPPDPPWLSGPSDGARSGTRLKLTYWRTEEGVAVWRPVFFDSQLAISCVPVQWRTGATYCTPFDEQTVHWTSLLNGSNNFLLLRSDRAVVPAQYLDDACTVPVGPRDATPDGYVVEYDVPLHTPPASRHEVQHLYRRGASRGSVAAYEKVSELGGCVLYAGQSEVFDLIEIPSSSLVAMRTLVDPVGSDGIAVAYVASDDGLQLPLGPYASVFDDVVAVAFPFGALQATGAPASASASAPVSGRYYADRELTVEVAAVAATAVRPATMLTQNPPQALGVRVATAFHLDIRGQVVTAPDDFVYYGLGAPVIAPTFVRRIDTLPGRRMQYIRDVAPAGLATREPLLYDADNQYECRLQGVDSGQLDGGDDVVSCVEVTCGHIEQVYADAACASAAMAVYVHDGGVCDRVPVPARVNGYPITSTPVIGRFYRKFLVGPGPPGTVVCSPQDFTAHAFQTGPQVTLKPIAQLRPVVDR